MTEIGEHANDIDPQLGCRGACPQLGPGLAETRGRLKSTSLLGANIRSEASAETSNSETDDDQSIASEGDIPVWPDTASEDGDDYDSCCRVQWSGCGINMSISTNIASSHSTTVSQPVMPRSWSDITESTGILTASQPDLSRSWSDITESTSNEELQWSLDSSTTAEDRFHADSDANSSDKRCVFRSSPRRQGLAPPSPNQIDHEDKVPSVEQDLTGDAADSEPDLATLASGTKSDFDFLADDQTLPTRDTATTLMVRNLPETVTQGRFIEELKRTGFDNMFDFCYVPTRSFKYHQGVGFAFVNFVNSLAAKVFLDRWHKSRRFNMRSGASWLNVSRARVQGRDANMTEAGSSRMLRIRNRSFKPFCIDLSDADPAGMEKAIRELLKRKPDDSEWQCDDERDDEQESWKPVGAASWVPRKNTDHRRQQWNLDASSSDRRSSKVHYPSQKKWGI